MILGRVLFQQVVWNVEEELQTLGPGGDVRAGAGWPEGCGEAPVPFRVAATAQLQPGINTWEHRPRVGYFPTRNQDCYGKLI